MSPTGRFAQAIHNGWKHYRRCDSFDQLIDQLHCWPDPSPYHDQKIQIHGDHRNLRGGLHSSSRCTPSELITTDHHLQRAGVSGRACTRHAGCSRHVRLLWSVAGFGAPLKLAWCAQLSRSPHTVGVLQGRGMHLRPYLVVAAVNSWVALVLAVARILQLLACRAMAFVREL